MTFKLHALHVALRLQKEIYCICSSLPLSLWHTNQITLYSFSIWPPISSLTHKPNHIMLSVSIYLALYNLYLSLSFSLTFLISVSVCCPLSLSLSLSTSSLLASLSFYLTNLILLTLPLTYFIPLFFFLSLFLSHWLSFSVHHSHMHFSPPSSVTKFGKFSPLWENFASLRQKIWRYISCLAKY